MTRICKPTQDWRMLGDVLMGLGVTLVAFGLWGLITGAAEGRSLAGLTRQTLERCAIRRAADPVTNTNLQAWSASMRFAVRPR